MKEKIAWENHYQRFCWLQRISVGLHPPLINLALETKTGFLLVFAAGLTKALVNILVFPIMAPIERMTKESKKKSIFLIEFGLFLNYKHFIITILFMP